MRVILACALAGILAVPANALDGTRTPANLPVIGIPDNADFTWKLQRGAADLLAQAIPQATEPAAVEEIYIARSVREARMPPTEFCAKARTGVDRPNAEDQFTFRSVATRTSDGRVTDTKVETIGSAHACGGPTANPAISQFYGEFFLGGIAFKAIGECHLAKADFPERGLNVSSCTMDVSDLPGDYIGGQVTTNTFFNYINLIGTETVPPGYTQSSIATIRLWKKRVQ
jgi:hypothetical protein